MAELNEKQRILNLIEEKETEIAKLMEEDNFKKVSENFKSMSDTTGTINTNGMWALKKKTFPSKNRGPVVAKRNEKGKLVTNPVELKKLCLDTFVSRLRHRKIKPGFEEIKILKEYLCSSRLEYCSLTKSSALTRKKMETVLKSLKGNKARDPHGLINELFHMNAIGDDLKESLFLMYKSIKEELVIPEVMEYANITSIYKGKGSKNDLQNERGIFGINIFRSLLLKIIYHDEYDTIDSNMSVESSMRL